MPVRRALIALVLCICGCSPESHTTGSDFLYVWSGDADGADADFLAVLDVRPDSPSYAQVLTTVPVPGRENWPHHTEYDISTRRTLFANGWNTGRTFVFDLSNPAAPVVTHDFGATDGYAYPHSYASLPNGNVLTTFQSADGDYRPSGGLVELDPNGAAVRAVSGRAPGIPESETWPYSLLVMADIDRVITTNTRMGTVSEWSGASSTGDGHVHIGRDSRPTHIQVWRLSDLRLLATLHLPPQAEGHNGYPAEPRRLASGAVYVNTFSCGLYRIDRMETDTPTIVPVLYSSTDGTNWCGVPVVLGNYWIQPTAERGIVTYDLSDPAQPREASRLALDSSFRVPHWLAIDPLAPRIVVTPDIMVPHEPRAWVLLVDVDPTTGQLSIDQRFRDAGADRPGVSFDRVDWPHGVTGRAMPHGAVFSVRR